METWRKTTLVQAREDEEWEALGDQVRARSVKVFDDDEQYDRCLIFLQEPRVWTTPEGEETDVCFNANKSF